MQSIYDDLPQLSSNQEYSLDILFLNPQYHKIALNLVFRRRKKQRSGLQKVMTIIGLGYLGLGEVISNKLIKAG